jgi:hypothetical protein
MIPQQEELDIITKCYLELSKKLMKDVKGLKWADIWADQLFGTEGKFPFSFPAVFFEFQITSIETKAGGFQEIEMNIMVRLCLDSYGESHAGSYNQTSALAYGRYLNAIYMALQGYSSSLFISKLDRKTHGRQTSVPYVYHYAQGFETRVIDAAAVTDTLLEVENGIDFSVEHDPTLNQEALLNEQRFDVD